MRRCGRRIPRYNKNFTISAGGQAGASRRDRIEEDERTVQVNLQGRSRAFSIVRYTLLGACWLCMGAAVLSDGAPERQLVLTGMSVTAGLIWFVSLLAEVLSCTHYEKRM